MGAFELVVVVGAIVAAVWFLTVRRWRRRKIGKPGCGCGTKDCPAGRR
jgi:hypothetical protein